MPHWKLVFQKGHFVNNLKDMEEPYPCVTIRYPQESEALLQQALQPSNA